ncbi:uncharacterized protein LOC103574575 [Microplitis demolitor]|uniref:uncharacterized protein LOC103574575 n=1 Tax=Microplitis demolitor TaxID=69319 RepID=UPI0004CD03E6|nr:uncharacterized protein LOC103574575 [Microplitis demolitor]
MKLFVFTVVAIMLFSFPPSVKTNAWGNTILSWLIMFGGECNKCTDNQVCLSEGGNGWKCTTLEDAQCKLEKPNSTDWFSSSLSLKCSKPNTKAVYKHEGTTYCNWNPGNGLWG